MTTNKATTMRISARNRDALLEVIAEHDDAATLDEALRIVLFEWAGYRSMAELAADPEALAAYDAETRALAECAVTVDDAPYDWGPDAETTSPRRSD
jgi:hypothetical protein